MKYYKLLNNDNVASHIKWDISGIWMQANKEIRGFRVYSGSPLIYHIGDGFNLFEVDIYGKQVINYDSVIAEYVRVVRQVSGYNNKTLFDSVIKPAADRAKMYMNKYYSTSAHASSATYVNWAEQSLVLALISPKEAGRVLLYAANAADNHGAGDWNSGCERQVQAKDVLKLLNNLDKES